MDKRAEQAAFEMELLKRQKENLFPAEQLPERYNTWKHAAFQFISIAQVRETFRLFWDDFRILIQKQSGYSLWDVFIINTVIQMMSPNELSKVLDDNYYDVQLEVVRISQAWNELMKPVLEAVNNRIAIMKGMAKPDFQTGGVRHINGGKH